MSKEEFLDFGDMELEDTFEPEVAEDGEEAELRVISVLINTDKNGTKYMMPFFELTENLRVAEFGDYMPLPNKASMNEKELNKAKLRINAFKTAFDIPSGQISMQQDVVGKTGWAILGIGTDKDGNPCNKIKSFVEGR